MGTSRIVKMRGLPFSVAVADILQWFNLGGLNIQPLGPNKCASSLMGKESPSAVHPSPVQCHWLQSWPCALRCLVAHQLLSGSTCPADDAHCSCSIPGVQKAHHMLGHV